MDEYWGRGHVHTSSTGNSAHRGNRYIELLHSISTCTRRFCYVVFKPHMFNATEVQLQKWCSHIKFVLQMRPIHVWRSRTPDLPSVITTIMDQKQQLLKPFNKYHVAELYKNVCVCVLPHTKCQPTVKECGGQLVNYRQATLPSSFPC
jgi:hypothetical protein